MSEETLQNNDHKSQSESGFNICLLISGTSLILVLAVVVQLAILNSRIDKINKSDRNFSLTVGAGGFALAEEAFNLALESIGNGEFDKGRVYLINAINHEPTSIKYVSELMKLARNNFSNDLSKLREIRSILELSLFQLEPKEIGTAFSLLAELDELDAKSAKSGITGSDVKRDIKQEFNKICSKKLLGLASDTSKLNERVVLLNELLGNISEDGHESDNLYQEIQMELQKSQELLEVTNILAKAEKYLKTIDEENDFASDIASKRFLAATTYMNALLEYDIKTMPGSITELITKTLPDKILLIEEKIKAAKSLPAFEKAKGILSKSLADNTGKFQEQINRLTHANDSVTALLPKIISEDFLLKLKPLFDQVRERILVCRQKQFTDYQKWAAERISEVLRKFNSYSVVTNNDARYILNTFSLERVDLRFLTPEVANAYQNVFQKVFAELNNPDYLEYQKKFMISEKKPLEEF